MMIDEKAVKLEIRLAAMEYFLAEAFRLIYALTGLSQEVIDRSHDNFRQHLKTMPMPPSDPTISDLTAQEMEEGFGRLLDMIGRAAKDRRKPV